MLMNNEKAYIIYMHKSPSGGVYIGQTKNKTSHRWGHDGHNYLLLDKNGKYLHQIFAKAIIKYG